jgi:hypothetical protein
MIELGCNPTPQSLGRLLDPPNPHARIAHGALPWPSYTVRNCPSAVNQTAYVDK